MSVFTATTPSLVRQRTHWIDRLAYAALALVAIILIAFLAAPLLAILQQSVEDKTRQFVGFDNFMAYAKTPAL
ncbi:MAG: putative 2-aminoethylphosphonate ABC transporter permease subunit, partial [Polaromonas sp.]